MRQTDMLITNFTNRETYYKAIFDATPYAKLNRAYISFFLDIASNSFFDMALNEFERIEQILSDRKEIRAAMAIHKVFTPDDMLELASIESSENPDYEFDVIAHNEYEAEYNMLVSYDDSDILLWADEDFTAALNMSVYEGFFEYLNELMFLVHLINLDSKNNDTLSDFSLFLDKLEFSDAFNAYDITGRVAPGSTALLYDRYFTGPRSAFRKLLVKTGAFDS
jgi:hypothetical protein